MTEKEKKVPDLIGIGQFLIKKETSWLPKTGIIIALVYLFFPFELIPDAIPIAGVLDDAGLMALSLWWLSYATKKYNINLLGTSEPKEPAQLEEHPHPPSVIDTKGEEVEEAKVEVKVPDLEH